MKPSTNIFAFRGGERARHSVHVIEPDEEQLIFLCDFLSLPGLLVTGSSDPVRGIEYVGKSHPDVLICDLALPAMGGEEVLNRTRKLSPRTRLILTSRHSGHGVVEHVRKGIGVDLLMGPFNAVELLQALERILKSEPVDLSEKKPC
jgi:DNA-binding response OmpR family regulator